MRKTAFVLLLTVLLAALLAGCGPRKDPAAQTMEAYWTALVGKQADTLKSLSCNAWESNALLEMNAFQNVEAKLDGMDCSKSGADGDVTLVQCKGKIVATYTNETQEYNLADYTYQLVQQNGQWTVCGYR